MVFSWTLFGLLLVAGVRYMLPDWKNGISIHIQSGAMIFVLTFVTSLYTMWTRGWIIGRKSKENEHYHDHIGLGMLVLTLLISLSGILLRMANKKVKWNMKMLHILRRLHWYFGHGILIIA